MYQFNWKCCGSHHCTLDPSFWSDSVCELVISSTCKIWLQLILHARQRYTWFGMCCCSVSRSPSSGELNMLVPTCLLSPFCNLSFSDKSLKKMCFLGHKERFVKKSLFIIINRVFRALDADWLKAVVYQIIYHGYDAKLLVYSCNYVGNQFIIAIRHLWSLWYMANMPHPLGPCCLNLTWGTYYKPTVEPVLFFNNVFNGFQ